MRSRQLTLAGLLLMLAGVTGAQPQTQTTGACTSQHNTRKPPVAARTAVPPALQAAAAKALANPRLATWERVRWQQIAAGKVVQSGYAKRTTYCPKCSGTKCADGSRVRRGVVSASPNVPMGATVWLETDGLLKVCDRGGLVKVGTVTWRGKRVTCTRPGETANFDVWVPRCAGDCWTGPGTKRMVRYVVVK